MLKKDRDVVKFLGGGSELSWVSFNTLFPIAHKIEMV
jgi:hypothetical protein